MIDGPKHLPGHPERGIDCEMATEQEFLALADRIGAAGRSSTEVAEALLTLSFNYLRFRQVAAEDEARYSKALRRACN